MQLKRLVFPAPFGPIKPTICPVGISKETLSNAATPPKRRLTSRTESKDVIAPQRENAARLAALAPSRGGGCSSRVWTSASPDRRTLPASPRSLPREDQGARHVSGHPHRRNRRTLPASLRSLPREDEGARHVSGHPHRRTGERLPASPRRSLVRIRVLSRVWTSASPGRRTLPASLRSLPREDQGARHVSGHPRRFTETGITVQSSGICATERAKRCGQHRRYGNLICPRTSIGCVSGL